MNKNYALFFACILLAIAPQIVLALGECNLDASLVNQDPYPVNPDNYVELVFEVSGTGDAQCNGATFEVVLDYPFSMDDEADAKKTLIYNTYATDYKKTWLIPMRLRIDENAMDGYNELEVVYKPGVSNAYRHKIFNVSIEDLRADFEVHIKDYIPATKELTLEILNIGEDDIEALTAEFLPQKNITIRGSPRNIIGSLDSNEETTFDFTAIPVEGRLDLQVTYTDEINVRRTLSKSVYYEPKYFVFKDTGKAFSVILSLLVTIAVLVVLIIFWRRYKKKKRRRF